MKKINPDIFTDFARAINKFTQERLKPVLDALQKKQEKPTTPPEHKVYPNSNKWTPIEDNSQGLGIIKKPFPRDVLTPGARIRVSKDDDFYTALSDAHGSREYGDFGLNLTIDEIEVALAYETLKLLDSRLQDPSKMNDLHQVLLQHMWEEVKEIRVRLADLISKIQSDQDKAEILAKPEPPPNPKAPLTRKPKRLPKLVVPFFYHLG